MKISVIGAGNVGGALGRSLAQKGHEIVFGVRDPQSEKVQNLLASIPNNAKADSNQAACAESEVIILTTPWQTTQAAIASCGDLTNKILIDCTNPLTEDFSGLTIGFTTSGGEQVAEWAKGAKVYKVFNQTGYGIMADPILEGHQAVMFVCGDDEESKPIVIKLTEDVGFETIDAGKLSTARLLEPYAMLWIKLALAHGLGRDFAFALIRRN